MTRERNEGDFVEALSRGLSVIRAFSTSHLALTVTEVAEATELARPTARRLLLTLENLGYVRSSDGVYT
ncbi:MAG: helix-turn-helix domain-containing protein, partial [Acidimicrobiaceae bacterium]